MRTDASDRPRAAGQKNLPDKRQVILDAIQFRHPAYVPWHVRLTVDCAAQFQRYIGVEDLEGFLDNHMFDVRSSMIWRRLA